MRFAHAQLRAETELEDNPPTNTARKDTMIAYLRGTVRHLDHQTIILDVNGVGYQVFSPTSIVESLTLEEETELHICTVVREDAFMLYGFQKAAQQKAFEALRGVNKIGAKLALTILSHLSIGELANAIEMDNSKALSAIPGIGAKTASRMCLELKDKLPVELSGTPSSTRAPLPSRVEDPLQLALAQLDYRKSEIDLVFSSGAIPDSESATLQERLSAALRFLATAG